MSLNDISLNNRLVAQLYAHTLLETAGNPPAAPAQKLAPQPQNPYPATAPAPVGDLTPKAASAPPPPAPAAQPQPESAALPENTIPALGGNKKGVLILVHSHKAPFLPDSDLEFLSAILYACKLSIADVAIVNLQRHPYPYTELVQTFQSRQVLLLGVEPQQIDLPFHFPHFQLQAFDGRTYLSSLPLGALAQDRDLKAQLWGCLKTMFGV